MLPINSFYNLANYSTVIPGAADAFQKGAFAAQDFIRKTIKEIINLNVDSFAGQIVNLSKASDIPAFYKFVDVIIDKLQNIASPLPYHLKIEFWEYARTILKEEITAFAQAQNVSPNVLKSEYIKVICLYINDKITFQHFIHLMP
jgi:hypothetical protein